MEFLPQATVADLQAILREDDMASLGERSMQRTTAHWLALRHWAAMDRPLHDALRQLDRGGEGLLAMLPTASEDELPSVVTGLGACYRGVLTGPDPGEMLQKVTPDQADTLLRHTLIGSIGVGAWDEALQVAGHASPTERRGYLLPNLATVWLNQQPAAATAWINQLPPEERQAVLEKAGSHYEFSAAGRAAFALIQP